MQGVPDSIRALLHELGLGEDLAGRVEVTGSGPVLRSPFRPEAAAATALGLQGVLLSALLEARGQGARQARIDLRAAGLALQSVMLQRLWNRPIALTEPDYPTVGIYGTRDSRFVMLNGGYPRLREGLLRLLRCADDVGALTRAVAERDAFELEEAIADNGLCGVAVRSEAEWRAHPQGVALAAVPAVELIRIGDAPPTPLPPPTSAGDRALAGLRVLDLTHVIAGPTSAKCLAEHGAEVLHVYGPMRPQLPPFDMDTGHGKRCAFLDVTVPGDVDTLLSLVGGADVFAQSYRPGRLAARGLSPERLAALRPGLVYLSVSCYGHTGPWHLRPGFEQLAQAATGMAVRQGSADAPLLSSSFADPYFPTDYVTGFLAASGVLAALLRRATEGGSWHVRVSLSRTAMMIQDGGPAQGDGAPHPMDPAERDALMLAERATIGEMRYLGPVLKLDGMRSGWDRPPVPLGADPPCWAVAA